MVTMTQKLVEMGGRKWADKGKKRHRIAGKSRAVNKKKNRLKTKIRDDGKDK